MPKGQKFQQQYDESDYNAFAPCGYYYQGRPSLMRIKLRLHRRSCPVCCKTRMEFPTKEDFKAIAPPERTTKILDKGLRSVDREHKEKEIKDLQKVLHVVYTKYLSGAKPLTQRLR